jgi:hypothetical protein
MMESLIHPLFEMAETEALQRARQLLDDRLSQTKYIDGTEKSTLSKFHKPVPD